MTEISRIKCGTGNCYIVSNGNNAILIDTGSKENLNKVISECNKYDMKLIVLTHVHFDHAENAAVLSEKYNIPVAINHLDEELFDSYDKQPLNSYGIIGKVILSLSIKKLENRKVEKPKNLIFVKDEDKLSEYGIDAKIARLAHTFGPGMSLDDGRVQADFLRNLVNDEDIVLKSDGSAIRTYTYVGDAVAALFYILLNGTETVYNISSEADTVSIKGLAEAMVKAYPEKNLQLKFEIPKSKSNNGSAPFTLGVLNSDKLKKLGWKPKYSLIEGIRRTVEFLREQ